MNIRLVQRSSSFRMTTMGLKCLHDRRFNAFSSVYEDISVVLILLMKL